MKQQDENYLSMAAVTTKILATNNSTWAANVPFAAAVSRIEELVALVNTARQETALNSTGMAVDKELAADAVITQAVKLSGLAQIYALDGNDITLHNRVKVTMSQLDRCTDAELTPLLENLYREFTALNTLLIPYGITEAGLAQFFTLLNNYKNLVSNPRLAITERKSHNTSIPTLLKELRACFNKTDRLIKIWTEDTKFVSDYQNARIIFDLGGRHEKKEIKL